MRIDIGSVKTVRKHNKKSGFVHVTPEERINMLAMFDKLTEENGGVRPYHRVIAKEFNRSTPVIHKVVTDRDKAAVAIEPVSGVALFDYRQEFV